MRRRYRVSKGRVCPNCQLVTSDRSGNKRHSRRCSNDIEATRRDAIGQGELEEWQQIYKNDDRRRDFLKMWSAEVGPSRGSGFVRGGFRFMGIPADLRALRWRPRLRQSEVPHLQTVHHIVCGQGHVIF